MIPRDHRDLPIELVDDPPAPTRLPEELLDVDSLAHSIKSLGQLQPGGVVPDGDRFVVVYGHRRLLACRALGQSFYSAYVYPSTSEALLDAQLAENVERKQLKPVEEAYWFAQLIEYVGGDTSALAEHLRMERDYVERRLNLLRGDPKVLDALRTDKIRLGVAERLNAYPHDADRLVLLDAAAAGGATERLVASWIAERKVIAASRGNLPDVDPHALAARPPAEAPEPTKCFFCSSDKHPYLMQPVWLHSVCKDMVDAILMRQSGGAHAQKDSSLPEPAGAGRADR